jgi:hypothetical protein
VRRRGNFLFNSPLIPPYEGVKQIKVKISEFAQSSSSFRKGIVREGIIQGGRVGKDKKSGLALYVKLAYTLNTLIKAEIRGLICVQ